MPPSLSWTMIKSVLSYCLLDTLIGRRKDKQTFRSLTEFEGRRNSVQNYNFSSKQCSPVLSRYFSQYKYSISLCVQQANEEMDTNIKTSVIILNIAVTRSRKHTTRGRWNTEVMSLNSFQSHYDNRGFVPLATKYGPWIMSENNSSNEFRYYQMSLTFSSIYMTTVFQLPYFYAFQPKLCMHLLFLCTTKPMKFPLGGLVHAAPLHGSSGVCEAVGCLHGPFIATNATNISHCLQLKDLISKLGNSGFILFHFQFYL
jgi:hypothetical protein